MSQLLLRQKYAYMHIIIVRPENRKDLNNNLLDYTKKETVSPNSSNITYVTHTYQLYPSLIPIFLFHYTQRLYLKVKP